MFNSRMRLSMKAPVNDRPAAVYRSFTQARYDCIFNARNTRRSVISSFTQFMMTVYPISPLAGFYIYSINLIGIIQITIITFGQMLPNICITLRFSCFAIVDGSRHRCVCSSCRKSNCQFRGQPMLWGASYFNQGLYEKTIIVVNQETGIVSATGSPKSPVSRGSECQSGWARSRV